MRGNIVIVSLIAQVTATVPSGKCYEMTRRLRSEEFDSTGLCIEEDFVQAVENAARNIYLFHFYTVIRRRWLEEHFA